MTVLIINEDVIRDMWHYERNALVDMIKESWLPLQTMKNVFAVVRPNLDDLTFVCKLACSHPAPDVRAEAAKEMLAYMNIKEVYTYLWR